MIPNDAAIEVERADPSALQDAPARTSALGSARSTFATNRRTNSAFTLVEMLLVLALMAFVIAVLLPAAGALFRKGEPADPAGLVAEVLQQARREAVLTGRPVTLRFDREAQRFAWDGTSGGSRVVEGGRLQIEFLRPVTTGAVLLGGVLVETGTTPTLAFYPDGTCDPVRVQIRSADGAPQVIAIDPWTCAPGLEVAS